MDILDKIRSNTFEQTVDTALRHFISCHPNITDDLARSTVGAMIMSFSRVYLDAAERPYAGGFTIGGISDALTAALINEPRERYGYFISTKPAVDYFSRRFLHLGVFDVAGAAQVTFADFARHLQTDSFLKQIGVRHEREKD